jgi:deoxycytidine triphosphate deaminase
VILSDRSIREELAAGRIKLEPSDDSLIQPASVDVRLDRYFRVFLNHTMPVIDVKKNLEELTRLVEIDDDRPFVLHPGEFVLGSTFERVALPDDLVARIEGKALALDTPVPTPTGWTTIGDLAPGDVVFHADGTPVPVLAATEVLHDRPCFEVRFSDGTVIVADAAHRWLTQDVDDRRRGRIGQVRSTEQIAATLERSARGHQHRVDVAAPVQYPSKPLPIDPYVLGAWLGDGTATQAVLTCADQLILDEIEASGCSVVRGKPPLTHRLGGAGHTGRDRRDESLSSRLHDLDLLGNKHIPDDYMLADVGQRQSLLEGLMDADGHVDRWGRCEFTTIRRAFARQVRELAASLGQRAVIVERRAMLDGVDHGPKFDVTFTPDRPVFRLPRKLARQKRSGTGRGRTIVSVTPTASVPVRCVQVDDSTGLFLVSRSFIPTHNSSLGRLGLLIHSTAGFIDAGFDGHITLELSNVANLPITLYPGMKIGQISFLRMTTPAEVPYGQGALGSKYQGQRGPTPSRYWENFDSS